MTLREYVGRGELVAVGSAVAVGDDLLLDGVGVAVIPELAIEVPHAESRHNAPTALALIAQVRIICCLRRRKPLMVSECASHIGQSGQAAARVLPGIGRSRVRELA